MLGTVVVENIGGAGGSLGAAAVARAQPDGYTILLGGGGALVINPIAATEAPYDPVQGFRADRAPRSRPRSRIVVHPALPVADARRNWSTTPRPIPASCRMDRPASAR